MSNLSQVPPNPTLRRALCFPPALLWHPVGAATIRIWKFVDRISKIFFNCLLALTSLTQHQTREIAPLSFPNPEQDLSNPEVIIVFVNE